MSGITYFGAVTGKMASIFTAQNNITNIESLHELSNQTIATKTGSTAALYLHNVSDYVFTRDTMESCISALNTGKVKAIVYDRPTCDYFTREYGGLCVSAHTFRPERYGMVFPKGSEWTDRFSVALLKMEESGSLDKLRQKWF